MPVGKRSFLNSYDVGDLPYGGFAEIQSFTANVDVTRGHIYTISSASGSIGQLIEVPVETPAGGKKGCNIANGGAWQALATVSAGKEVQCAGFGSRIIVGISGQTKSAGALSATNSIRPGSQVYLAHKTVNSNDVPDNPYVLPYDNIVTSGVAPPQAYLGRVWEILEKDTDGNYNKYSSTSSDLVVVEVGRA